MPLKRTTTRALAASVALVAAGGTVAGAAVFHLPVLGFGPANAGATASAVVPVTKKVAPVRVVKTRFVDQIVHRRAATRAAAEVAPLTGAATAPSVPSPSGVASPTTAPEVDSPTAPEAGGAADHQSDDSDHEAHGTDGHEDHGDESESGTSVQSGAGALTGQ